MAHVANFIVFFNREKFDKKGLEMLLRRILSVRGVVVYPEGTRALGPQPRPLRYGIIRMAYRTQTPVQIVITTNKERVFCLKTLTADKNVSLRVYRSEVLRPEDSKDIDQWCKTVAKRFQESWDTAYDNHADVDWKPHPALYDTSDSPGYLADRVRSIRHMLLAATALLVAGLGWLLL
jgi:1-acyl-sn-glycerol-3-phosphate acyltransferase